MDRARAVEDGSCRVAIADDHPLFRQALVSAIRRLRPDSIIDEYDSLGQLESALSEGRVNLLLLDLKLPDCDGFAGLLRIKSFFEGARVAIVSATEDLDTIDSAMMFGAVGFIPKSTSVGLLGEALQTILSGKVWRPPMLDAAAGASSGVALSPAQVRMLSALQRGLMNKQIAYELGVTEATVKAHMTSLFRKLGVRTRTQALLVTNIPSQP